MGVEKSGGTHLSIFMGNFSLSSEAMNLYLWSVVDVVNKFMY